MKRPTERITRHTVVGAVAVAIVMAFAGVGLSQVVASTPQAVGGPTTGSTSSTTGTSTGRGNGGQGNGQKVQICHKTRSKKHPAHTISVSKNAEPSFLARGDREGACTAADMQPITTTSTTSTTSTTQSSTPKSKSKPKNNKPGKSGKNGKGRGK